MGIDNFKTLLEKCPSATRYVPIKRFSGKRVAVDAGNLMHKTICRPWSNIVNRTNYPGEIPDINKFHKNWINELARSAQKFLVAGITPVYVFDGKSPPEKKDNQIERQKKRERVREKYESALSKLIQYPQNSELLQEVRKNARQIYPDYSELIYIMKEFFISMGLPVLQSVTEADFLCVSLCLEGYCSAAVSTDRDFLVHGCPILINGFGPNIQDKQNISYPTFEIILLDELLFGLDLTFKQFIEICIMFSCDYNSNIPGMGAKRSYALYKEYGDILSIPNTRLCKYMNPWLKKNPDRTEMAEHAIQFLKFETCLRMFSRKDITTLVDKPISELRINLQKIEQVAPHFLGQFQLAELINSFLRLYQLLPEYSDRDGPPNVPPNILRGTGIDIWVLSQLNVDVDVEQFVSTIDAK